MSRHVPSPGAFAPGPRRLVAVLAAALLLAGCYLPDDFEAAVQVAADGRYAFRYEGDLTQLQFLQRIGTGELQGEKLAEYVDIYARDLKRDSGFKSVSYESQARYAVHYERSGDLARSRQFSFPRRNAAFLGLRVRDDGNIELFGDKLPERHREELIAKGFDTRGVLRVWVRGEVLSHNATEVAEGAPAMYEWRIGSMRDPTPHLVLAPAGSS